MLYPKYLFNHDSLHSSINIFEECDTSGMKCVYWHAESLVYPIGNATLFTAHKLASRRETAVPAFSPPDSPLFQFPVARNVCWYFPSITAPAVSRLHRLTSRLKCSASFARAEFLQRVRRLLTGGSLRPGARARRQPPRITIPRRGFATAPFLQIYRSEDFSQALYSHWGEII